MFSFRTIRKTLAALALSAAAAVASPALADMWSFGVMADTQWSGTDPTGNNVNSVAVNQIKACNAAFVAAGVDFVVQVGDLGDNGSTASLATRLAANSDLTAAGIAFYGLRGNHESSSTAQSYFQANYIPTSTASATVALAPDNTSYSVTYKDTKIVLLDISIAGSVSNLNTATTWMSSQLSADDHTQAFVFSHKNLLGQNHKDNEFGSSNDANPTQQNNFIKAMDDNGVRYYLSGHDHLHYRSIVMSPDGQSSVQQMILASDSYKYYTPSSPYSSRETPIAEQLYETGYYIFTVDGPRVTGKYYYTTPLANGDISANPVWVLGETFGYSLNGKEFVVASGGDLGVVQDSYGQTSMHLTGINGSTETTYDGRRVSKDINTGWTDKSDGFASDALTLWGMEDVDMAATIDDFTLTMSYQVPESYAGEIYLAYQDANGIWNRLLSILNGDGTVSATIDHDGTFAVVPEPATLGLLIVGGVCALIRRKRD